MMIIRILILVLTCLVSLNPISAEDLRIPVLVGQTGASQTFGRNESDGYKLAAEEWNAKGGVNGRRVVLEFEDTETVARKTMSAFQLQLARGAQVVLGPTWLDSFPALIPIARKKGRASQFFITTEDAEDTENGHFMGNYGVFSVSSASSVVKNILLIVSAAYQKHCDALQEGRFTCYAERGDRGFY
jgi:hypothetical protein